ncbi:MAG: BamA/TamA family outer membrane protein [Gemmatimonadaceae bacterium]
MRTLILLLVTAVAAEVVSAQAPDTARRDRAAAGLALPNEVAADVAWLFNQPAALRSTGRAEIAAGQVVEGDVAVLGGPLIIAGRITGRALVINGDVSLRHGAVVERNLIVVGGVIEGQERATIGGDVRWYPQPMRYRLEEGRVVVAESDGGDERPVEDGWLRRWLHRYEESRTRPVLWTANPYNRVEGLPTSVGLSFRERPPWGRVDVDLLGIIRSPDNFEWDSDNLGHDVRASVRFGGRRGFFVGGGVFDVVEPVERWQLRDTEIGLAAFFFHRDYRDYYDRRGGSAHVTLTDGRGAALTLRFADERWGAREDRGPFSLLQNGDLWRPNPRLDEGRFRIASARASYDTRNDERDPWTGWLIAAELEHGRGRDVTLAPTSPAARAPALGTEENVRYTRAFLDARRYNRVSPRGQLNFRLVLGGWVGGDELPLQRRLSLGGSGTLPGYDFRGGGRDGALLHCAEVGEPAGRPAQCERIALMQAEYRGDVHVSLGGRTRRSGEERGPLNIAFDRTISWVLFFDSGRGWLVGDDAGGANQFASGDFPPLSTFRSDFGVGIDLDLIGFYVAKPLSGSSDPVNFFVRLRHRF